MVIILVLYGYPDQTQNHLEEISSQEILDSFNKELDSESKENFENSPGLAERSKGKNLSWLSYQKDVFGNIGSTPPNSIFYVKKLYRKPYRYPLTYQSSYPYTHQSPFQV